VGKIIRFWPRGRRFKGLEEFDSRQRIRCWPDDDKLTLRGVVRETLQWLGYLRPFILLAILVSLYIGAGDPALVEPLGFLSSEPEQVREQFSNCGPAGAQACVIDGDTFRLGERRIRIIGIDAPETHPPRCAKEAELGEMATGKLRDVLNEGPFEMVAPVYRDHDRYGRDLRVIRRKLPDGSYQSIASEMRESLARRYLGGFRGGWC
jgi:hypothetical protein